MKYWSNLGQVLRRIPPKALLKRSKVYNELVYSGSDNIVVLRLSHNILPHNIAHAPCGLQVEAANDGDT